MKKVIITDDEQGGWNIYDENGQALEVDFDHEQEAIDYATDQGWRVVFNFNL